MVVIYIYIYMYLAKKRVCLTMAHGHMSWSRVFLVCVLHYGLSPKHFPQGLDISVGQYHFVWGCLCQHGATIWASLWFPLPTLHGADPLVSLADPQKASLNKAHKHPHTHTTHTHTLHTHTYTPYPKCSSTSHPKNVPPIFPMSKAPRNVRPRPQPPNRRAPCRQGSSFG